ncbi:MAG: DUF692 domain-containing protein [Pseudomonas sp.]
MLPPLSANASARTLPARAGLGLKSQHYQDVLNGRPDIGFFEVHAENYMVAGGPFHHYLGQIRQHYPLSLHGVGLSIGGEQPLDMAHLQRLAELNNRYQPQRFSEHLAWSSHGPTYLNDLLPVAYDRPTLKRVCAHIDQVQNHLQRQLLLENPATYVEFSDSCLEEAAFICEVVENTGCGLLLDLNNVYVSCINHQRDAQAYLRELPLAAVGEIHLAGFTEDCDSAGARLLIDSHGAAVDNAVWALCQQVIAELGPLPTLIEWDNDVPTLAVLMEEAQRAERILLAGGGPL